MPKERVFSKTNHRVRYKGIKKNQFTAFMESIVHNLKRWVVIEAEKIIEQERISNKISINTTNNTTPITV